MADVAQLLDARKEYRMGDSTVHALAGVSLDIKSNDYLAITGASGSGKSTLMHIMGLMDTLSSGQLIIAGQDITRMSPAKRATLRSLHIGFIFQSFNLLPRLTVLDNVLLPVQYLPRKNRPTKEDALTVLDRVGLGDRVKHIPNELSGGQRQRVAIARALINKPGILLADEPTGNLDSENTALILDLFDQLHKEGQAIVIVTHEADVAARTQRYIRMQDGKIIKEGRS